MAQGTNEDVPVSMIINIYIGDWNYWSNMVT